MLKDQPGRRRKALLVIHGIGDQPPLRVLGAFVQGLLRASRGEVAGRGVGSALPTAEVADLAGKARPMVRLPEGVAGEHELDVIEYHWAEHAVGGMSAAATFGWLLEVVVAGLDFRRQVPFLLAGHRPRSAWRLVLRQLLQVAGLAGVASGLMVAALFVTARAGDAVTALLRALAELPGLPSLPQAGLLVLLLCLLAAVAVLAYDLLFARVESRRAARAGAGTHVGSATWSGMYAPAAERWTAPGLTVLLITACAAGGLGYVLWPVLAAYGAVAGILLTEPGLAVALAALAVMLVGRSLLLSHVADIALYVTSDRLSSRARTRRAILDEGEELLRALLGAGYEGVYVAGHSLGSVVALDLLDRLARDPVAASDVELARLKGLLTFGSPLDKVAYFFRQRPAEGESVRAQLINRLHGVRRRPDMRDHGPFALGPHVQPFETLDWLQVHAPGDLLSDRLIHYRVDRRLVLPNYNLLTAHNAYWRDDRFFAGALGWLRGAQSL
ncbi:MAG: hypothetical protein WDA03_04470 [Trueperaceae bacterium]